MVLPDVKGRTAIAVQFDSRTMIPPARQYAADVACAFHKRGLVHLLFAQQSPFSDNVFDSLLIIKLTQKDARQLLSSAQSPNSDFLETLESFQTKSVPRVDFATAAKEGNVQSVALSASVGLMAQAGQMSSVDFYLIAAQAAAVAARNGPLVVDPVVRVEIASVELLGLLQDLQEIMEDGFGEFTHHESI